MQKLARKRLIILIFYCFSISRLLMSKTADKKRQQMMRAACIMLKQDMYFPFPPSSFTFCVLAARGHCLDSIYIKNVYWKALTSYCRANLYKHSLVDNLKTLFLVLVFHWNILGNVLREMSDDFLRLEKFYFEISFFL